MAKYVDYKVGCKVKLKDNEQFPDYRWFNYKNQIGIIESVIGKGKNTQINVRWSDNTLFNYMAYNIDIISTSYEDILAKLDNLESKMK